MPQSANIRLLLARPDIQIHGASLCGGLQFVISVISVLLIALLPTGNDVEVGPSALSLSPCRTLICSASRKSLNNCTSLISYQRSEQALVLTRMEMVVDGVSTRKVARIPEELCGTCFDKSTVSDLCKARDPLVSAWNERSRSAQRFPVVLVDALVVKVREEGRVWAGCRPSAR